MVFWFVGMSGAGKTTIGSMLEDYLHAQNIRCYRLDGDEIRAFFDRDLGFGLEGREQNMKRLMLGAYLLGKNEIIAIVCAVTPVERWRIQARNKIANYHEFWLKRDPKTLEANDVKGVYEENRGRTPIAGIDIPFDEPRRSDLVLNTDDETEVETFARVREYVDTVLNLNKKERSISYWRGYYVKHPLPTEPSPFSGFALNYIKSHFGEINLRRLSLIEFGCGNGRDAILFARGGVGHIKAVDQVEDEINLLKDRYGETHSELCFAAKDFTLLSPADREYDVVYSRFTWHAITEEEENRCLDWIASALSENGLLFIEARSITDRLYGKGKIVSATESVTDHYRRFVDLKKLLPKLEKHGLALRYVAEETGFAPYGDEDPVIVRIAAERNA